jgi:hypothetical protein
MKYIATIFLTALVVGFGVTAYFKGWLPTVTFYKPQAVSIQNTEILNKEVASTPSPIPSELASASATVNLESNEAVLLAVKAAMIKKHGEDFFNMNYSLTKVEGNYASGSVSGTGGGGMWFAAKVNNEWKIVYDGNGVIMCNSLLSYPTFPKNMIPECWDASTNGLIKR